jgi:hypothetical protein
LPENIKVKQFQPDPNNLSPTKKKGKKIVNYETSSAKDNDKDQFKNKFHKRDYEDPYKFNDDNSSGCGIKSMSSAPWDIDEIEKD